MTGMGSGSERACRHKVLEIPHKAHESITPEAARCGILTMEQ